MRNRVEGELFAPSLRLRTSPPQIPPSFVRRPRIDAMLARAAPGVVTVVCAAPGYGKTLAVADWLGRTGVRTVGHLVWLLADETRDIHGFWTDVVGALRMAGVVDTDRTVRDLIADDRVNTHDVERIIDLIVASEVPIALVVDDFHRISEAAVLESFARLVARRIPNLRLFLIGRTHPSLRLTRLQLDQACIEIAADELAFTSDEVAELCRRSGTEPSASELEILLERTQGWPAGVRLALLSTTGPGDSADLDRGLRHFRGSNRLVAAYLLEEVLSRLTASDRRFLLSTSIVPMITADLARALTGRADSQTVLDRFVEDNMLTVRLQDRPEWFAYHRLLRELLVDRLTHEHPDSVQGLHESAAVWYLRADDPCSALRHLIAARNWDALTEVLVAVAMPLVLTPQASALAAALDPAIDTAATDPNIAVLLCAAVVSYVGRDYHAMSRYTEDARRLCGVADGRLAPLHRLGLTALEVADARVRHLDRIAALSDELAALARAADPVAVPAASRYALIAQNNRAIALVQSGDLLAARPLLEDAWDWGERASMTLMAGAADAYLSLVDVLEGHLAEADCRIAQGLARASERGWSRHAQVLPYHAAAALSHLEAARPDDAARCVAAGREVAGQGADLSASLLIEVAAVGVSTARADLYAARDDAARLQAQVAGIGPLPELLGAMISTALADVEILAGHAVEVVATRVPDPRFAYARRLVTVGQARALLAAGEAADALDLLGSPEDFAPYRMLAVEAAVLAATAANRLRRDALALDRITAGISLASNETGLRPFAAFAAELGPLLARHGHLVTSRVAVVERKRFPASDAVLTDRELAVLHYLPTMYKSSEIASDLFVSVNTVKSHMQSIYRKLGVSTRRAAVEEARARHLI